jgi:hypothetical protein
MRLLADRRRAEWLLRAIASLALAGLAMGAFLDRSKPGGRVIDSRNLSSALVDWVANPSADTMGLRLTGGLDPTTLDYLRALRAAGSAVAWSNEGIEPIMLEAESLQDPAGGVMARVGGPAGTSLALFDSLGVLDSMSIDRLGRTVRVPAFSGSIAVSAGSTRASTVPRSPGPVRSVVVLGLAGWESKFTVRALEERGWKVESRIGIAPNLSTIKGKPFPLDTARHATVIALDSSAAGYVREIQRFARSGGGLIVAPGASAYFAQSPSADVITRTRGDRSITLAAWRTGSGRVIRTDQLESWRWRMVREENAVANHREWWAGLVGAVAYRPGASAGSGDPAPLATLTQELGPPGTLPGSESATSLWPVALAVFLVSLFAEWLSRRLRGAT